MTDFVSSDGQPPKEEILIDPFTGERIFLPEQAEKIDADLKAKRARGKPADVWSAEEFAKALGLEKSSGSRALALIRNQVAEGKKYAQYAGLTIPEEAIVEYELKNRVLGYGIRIEWGKKVAEAYRLQKGEERGKPDDTWSVDEFAQALVSSRGTSFGIINNLLKQLEASESHVDYLGIKIPTDAGVKYWPEDGSKLAYGIKSEWGEKIAVAYKELRSHAKSKPEGYWSTSELGNAIQAVAPHITDPGATGRNIVSELRKQLETCEIGNYRGVVIPKEAIAAYDYNNRPAYAIRREEGQKIVVLYTARKKKPDGYWSAQEFGLAIRQQHPDINSHESIPDTIIRIIRDQLRTNDFATYKGIHVGKEAIAEYEYNSNVAYAIRQTDAEKLAIAYTPEKGVPAGYWSTETLGKAIQAVQPSIKTASPGRSIISEILQQYRKPGVDTANYKGVSVPRSAILSYEYKGKPTHAIREEEAKAIVAHCATEERGIPKGYWSGNMLGQAIQKIKPVSDPSSFGAGIISSIRQEHENSGIAVFQDVSISRDDIKDYTYNNKTCYAIRQGKGVELANSYQQSREIPPGYLSGKVFGEALQKAVPEITNARAIGKMVITDVRKQRNANGVATYKGVPVSEDAIKQYGYGNHVYYAIRQQETEQIINAWNTYERKSADVPEGYWSSKEFGSTIIRLMHEQHITPSMDEQTTGTSIISFIRKKLAESKESTYKGVLVSSDSIQEFKGDNGRSAYAIRQHEGKLIADAYVMDKKSDKKAEFDRSDSVKSGANITQIGIVNDAALPEVVIDTLEKKKLAAHNAGGRGNGST